MALPVASNSNVSWTTKQCSSIHSRLCVALIQFAEKIYIYCLIKARDSKLSQDSITRKLTDGNWANWPQTTLCAILQF